MQRNERRLHEPSSVAEADELAQRRERGRRAQRAFRQRQVDTIQELRASNEAMQAAIASLARVAARVDSNELTTAVQEACRVAGIGDAQASSIGENISGSNDYLMTSHNETTVSKLQSTSSSSQGPGFPTLRTAHDDWAQNHDQIYRPGRMSPRLSYGVWFEPAASLTVEYPPIDIIPYLREDKSLASIIFWASISWGSRIVGAALNGHSGAITIAHEIFGTIFPIKPDHEVLNCLHARLIYRQKGTIDRDHPGIKPDMAPRLHAAMLKLHEENSTMLANYLTPVDVDNLFRSRLGDAYAAIDRSVKGLGTPEETARLRTLVNAIVKSSVSLGDGPRLSVGNASHVLGAWISDMGLPWHFPQIPAHQRVGG